MKNVHGMSASIAAMAIASSVVLGTLPGPNDSASASTVELTSGSALTPDDIAVVDGVLFGIGPLARQLGNSVESVVAPADLSVVEDYAVDARDILVETKPDEVAAAVAKIRSGSVNAVSAGIDDLGTAFTASVTERFSPEEIQAATEKVGSVPVAPMCGAVAVCAAAVAVVVYAAAVVHNAAVATAAGAVVVSVALWCGAWVGCGRDAQLVGDDRVKREKFLANATRVAGALPA